MYIMLVPSVIQMYTSVDIVCHSGASDHINSLLLVMCILFLCGFMCSFLQSKDAGIRAVVMLDEQGGNQFCLIFKCLFFGLFKVFLTIK